MNSVAQIRRWGPVAGAVAAVVMFFAQVVFAGRVFFLKDTQLWFYPSRLSLRNRLLSFDLPHWQPHIDFGAPFLADLSNGVLYPMNVILLLPAPACVGIFLVAHVVLAAVGSALLLGALGVGAWPRLLGALGFGLGGYLVSMTWSGNYLLSVGWMPLISWLSLRVMRGQRRSDVAWMGLALGTQLLSGELQGAWLTGWVVLALLLGYPRPWRAKVRSLALLGAAAGIGLCLAAPQLLPTLELLPSSRRGGGIALAEASHWSFHPLRVLELLVPNLFGNALHHATFLGYFMNDEGSALHRDPWMVTPHLGSLSIVFSALALWRARARHRWWTRSLGCLALVAIALAFGRHTPVFRTYFELVPGAALFRYPAKFFALVAFCLPLLAAAGLDGYATDDRQERRFSVLATGVLCALVAALLLVPVAAPGLAQLRAELQPALAHATLRGAIAIELAVFAVAAFAVMASRRFAVAWVGACAVLLLAVQLVRANWSAFETADASIYARPRLAERIIEGTPAGEPPRMLHTLPALDIPGLDALPGMERAKPFGASLMRNTGIIFGIGYADAYSATGSPRHRALWRATEALRRQTLNLFAVRFVVLPKNEPVAPGVGLLPLEGVGEIGGVAYADERVLPVARPVERAILAADAEEALRLVAQPAVLEGRAVVLEADTPLPSVAPAEPLGECRSTRPFSDEMELDCRLAQTSWVVISVSHHPNWTARVDDQPGEIIRANAIAMALRVPAGEHRLHLSYAEPSLPFGGVIAAFGLLAVLALLMAKTRRSTRGRGA